MIKNNDKHNTEYEVINKKECDDTYYEAIINDFYITAIDNLKSLLRTLIEIHTLHNSLTSY
jgi:hypothetical protein